MADIRSLPKQQIPRRTPTTLPPIGGMGQNRQTSTFSSEVSPGSSSAADSSTATRTFTPSGPAPTFERPTFDAPEFDERAVSSETQRLQAPSIRKLRRSLQEVQTQRFGNPNVRRMTIRDALAGFGAGLESIGTGARREARATVGEKFAREADVAKTQCAADQQTAQAAYQRAWDLYLKTGTETITSGPGPVSPEQATLNAAALKERAQYPLGRSKTISY